jgi:hypothetical protein
MKRARHWVSPEATMQTEALSPPPDRFVNDVEAAAILGLSRGYLRTLRVRGGGSPYSTFGKAVRYRLPLLLEWADSRTVASTSDRPDIH